jgi:hypothetical protein
MVDFKRLDLVNDGNIIKAAKETVEPFAVPGVKITEL